MDDLEEHVHRIIKEINNLYNQDKVLEGITLAEAVAKNITHQKIYSTIGQGYFNIKEFASAETNFKKCIDLANQNTQFSATEKKDFLANIWEKLGDTLSIQEKFNESLEAYQNSVNIYPQQFKSWFNVAITQCSLGLFDEAIKVMTYATTIEPNNPEFWKFLCTSYYCKEDYVKAKEAILKSIKIKDDIINMPITSQAIEYNKEMGKRNLKTSEEVTDKRIKNNGATYSKSYMFNAVELLQGNKPLTLENLEKKYGKYKHTQL